MEYSYCLLFIGLFYSAGFVKSDNENSGMSTVGEVPPFDAQMALPAEGWQVSPRVLYLPLPVLQQVSQQRQPCTCQNTQSVEDKSTSIKEKDKEVKKWSKLPLIQLGNKRYHIVRLKMTWAESLQFCRLLDMELLSLHSKLENDLLMNYLQSNGLQDTWLWSSGTDAALPGTFVWQSSGTPFTFADWYTGNPTATAGDQCVNFNGKKWYTNACHNNPHGAICEVREE